MIYESERLTHLHQLVHHQGAKPARLREYIAALKSLHDGPLYWKIFEQEEKRAYQKKDQMKVAETVYQLYWNRPRYHSYQALKMAYNKLEASNAD